MSAPFRGLTGLRPSPTRHVFGCPAAITAGESPACSIAASRHTTAASGVSIRAPPAAAVDPKMGWSAARPMVPGGAGSCCAGAVLRLDGGVGNDGFAAADDDVLAGERLQLVARSRAR